MSRSRSKKRVALITGITGQDGSYLAEWLLEKGYRIFGLVRRTSTEPFERIVHIRNQVEIVSGDLLDQLSLLNILQKARPHEVYNLAAQSYVSSSFDQPVVTGDITALGVARLLEAIKFVDRKIRFYQASSSEMFGLVRETPQTLKTAFHPRSPYGVAKLYGHAITINYRESYGLFAVSGVLYNHESPRRGKEFVSRKISRGVARIQCGIEKKLRLGNLDAKRDWGFAGDYVKAMWRMLQQPRPEDFLVATGKQHSVKDFVRLAFRHVGLDWEKYVTIDPSLYRPAEVHSLCGDSSEARKKLHWSPTVDFEGLVKMMVDHDLEALRRPRRPDPSM